MYGRIPNTTRMNMRFFYAFIKENNNDKKHEERECWNTII